MASTYTPAGIELIADGEQSNAWGNTTNTNWELMEEMVTGGVSIALVATTYTLTMTDGASSNGRHVLVTFTGSPGATCTVTVSPNDMQKLYFIRNNSDQTVTIAQGSGSTVNVAPNKVKLVFCDGAGSGAAVTDLSSGFDATTLVELGVTATSTELNTLDGITATTAELNTLDGITSSTAELNILDGVTATAAELNVLDGITSSTAELNILDGVTATYLELNTLDGITATTAELNKLDGYNGSATELNYAKSLYDTGVTSTEYDYLDGVTSAIQTQLNGKQPTITGAASSIDDTDLTANRAVISNANGKIDVSAVTSTELGYLDGVTSSVQTQLNGKQATITGGATSITGSNLTASRALVSDGSGKVAVSAVTSTEIGYLDGVTSAIQTQINGKASLTGSGSYNFTAATLFATTLDTGAWTVSESSGVLYFKYNGVNKMKLDSSGNLTVTGNVTAYGTV